MSKDPEIYKSLVWLQWPERWKEMQAEAGKRRRVKHQAEELQLCPMDPGSHEWF